MKRIDFTSQVCFYENMSKKTVVTRRELIKGYDSLEELALDFACTWMRNHCVDKVWEQLDPELWEQLRNPWALLQSVSTEKLESLLKDSNFSKMVEDLVKANRKEITTPGWFQQKYPNSTLSYVAYFSMEYMLSESLPIYSGGLGNVAGDQLKAASDLGVPVVGIGLLYQQGYFRQVIGKDGAQHALYPYNDPGQLPITPLRRENGELLRLEVVLPGWSVWLRVWKVNVGKVKLYLLDTNDAVNFPPHRGITSELYGGDSELRLKQELVLGIGGWKLLEVLGINPEVCHLNEGHAAFAILERAKSFMKEAKVSFEIALAATRAGNHFTTHTAVPAGFDRFTPALIEQYLGNYAVQDLGITLHDLLALGRQNPNDSQEYFNMANLAMRGSSAINGVSLLHKKVSRYLFGSLFPGWPIKEVPIGHVTNGIHVPSWNSVAAGELWKEYGGKSCWLGEPQSDQGIETISDAKLWKMRNDARKTLIEYSRARLAHIWEARAFPSEEIERAKHIFDPNIFTLGFARRFATYKRTNLLLHDKDRLLRILTNPQRPVQLIISGKAHPADKPGQALIQEWIQLFFNRPEARTHIIFLSDYDMLVTANLVRGVDLWINTPRRPWEACGTSGMKILGNGGVNLSELDGWWVEAYNPEVGWALGDGKEHGEDPTWDAAEANALYELLEKQIIPEFYSRDNEGIPTKWIARIRKSMAELTPRFSADRAVRDYTEKYYLPAAAKYRARTENSAELAKKIVGWKHSLDQTWNSIRFGELKINRQENRYHFEVQVYLDDLDPNSVKVEIFADALEGKIPERIEMKRLRELSGAPKTFEFEGSVATDRPVQDYTVRIIPSFKGVEVPLEATHIRWQR